MKNLQRLKSLPANADIFLGLDLAKTSWHVTARYAGETLADFAAPAKPTSLVPPLDAVGHCRVHSVYEAGPFGYSLHDWLAARGVDSIVCAPGLVPTQVSNRVKTDRRDALKLATLLEAGLLRSIVIPTLQQRADRELVRERDRIVRRRRAVMVQIRAFLLTYGIEPPIRCVGPWTKQFVAALEALALDDRLLQATFDSLLRGYREVDRHLLEHTRLLRQLARDDRHAATVTLLSSIPGFGLLTSLTFSVEIFDWSRFESGETLSSYLGLTPSQYSSGERVRMGRITRVGNRRLRSLLVEACWNALRVDPALRKTYDDLKRRRGGKRAVVAIARRMCHRIAAMTRTGECYRLEAA